MRNTQILEQEQKHEKDMSDLKMMFFYQIKRDKLENLKTIKKMLKKEGLILSITLAYKEKLEQVLNQTEWDEMNNRINELVGDNRGLLLD